MNAARVGRNSMSSWFARSFGSALADVRQRVLEEPYFGKIVTPRATSITLGSPGEKSPGEALGWFSRNFEPDPTRQPEPGERDIHGNTHSLER
jgi:hypothetical protein